MIANPMSWCIHRKVAEDERVGILFCPTVRGGRTKGSFSANFASAVRKEFVIIFLVMTTWRLQ
jgi:hypothetical protein